MTKPVRTHAFADAGLPADHKGRAYCTCGARQDHPRHNHDPLPPTPADAAELEQRRMGERE